MSAPAAVPAVVPAEVLLHRGLVDRAGARHRRAALRPLGGRTEAALAERPLPATTADVSALLAAGLRRLGGYEPVTAEHATALSRGDRQRLALALRRLMLGDRLVLTVRCPDPDCGELADLDLRISALLDPPAGAEPEELAVDTADGPVRLRVPTGADDEAIERLPAGAEAAAALWDRLVLSVAGRPGGPGTWAGLAPASRALVARALVDSGSVPDLAFVSPCPACRAWIEVELDPADLLVRELGQGSDRLLAEVHCLAFHYGWTEAAILDLPRPRRWRYLELVRSELEGRPLLGSWS